LNRKKKRTKESLFCFSCAWVNVLWLVAREGRKKPYQKEKEKNERKVCYGSSDNAYGFVATIKEKTRGNNKNNSKRKKV